MILNGLCMAPWVKFIPDIAVGIFFIIMIIISAKKGFVGCILSIVSTLAAIFLAITFAGLVVDATDGLFGLKDGLIDSFTKTFSKIGDFNADISQIGVEDALEGKNVSSIVARLVLDAAGKQEVLAPGTTLAVLLGQSVGDLAARLIVGLLIFIFAKIVIGLLKKVISSLLDKIPALGKVNRILGAVFGILYAWVIASAFLAVIALVPVEAITLFLEKTFFVGFLYEHNILIIALSWFI